MGCAFDPRPHCSFYSSSTAPTAMAAADMCDEIRTKRDSSTSLRWLDPHILADSDVDFLIYSPLTCSYLFMSKDPSFSHKMHTKLEAHATREFERNLFKLKKTEDGKYNLHNVETEKHVYVSGDDVLGMDGNPAESKAHFEFMKYGDSGCYMIKNNEKYIYVSKNKAGIPPCPVVHAAETVDDCAHVFQFVLLQDVKNATVSFETESAQKITGEKKTLVYEFENSSDVDKKEEVTIELPDATKSEFKFESGFEFFGQYVGGAPAQCVVDDHSVLKVIESNVPRSIDSDDLAPVRNAKTSSSLTVGPGRKTTVTVTVVENKVSVPFTIEVTTASKKVLKGSGAWVGCATVDSSTDINTESLDGSKE